MRTTFGFAPQAYLVSLGEQLLFPIWVCWLPSEQARTFFGFIRHCFHQRHHVIVNAIRKFNDIRADKFRFAPYKLLDLFANSFDRCLDANQFRAFVFFFKTK